MNKSIVCIEPKRDMNRVHLACKRLYAFCADIIDTKYEAARVRNDYAEITVATIVVLWKKYREIHKNLRAASQPSSRSRKGKVFRVNEFLSCVGRCREKCAENSYASTGLCRGSRTRGRRDERGSDRDSRPLCERE